MTADADLVEERELLARVLFSWASKSRSKTAPTVRPRSTLQQFDQREPLQLRYHVQQSPLPLNTAAHDSSLWLVGEAVEARKTLFPVVSVALKVDADGRPKATFRAALFHEANGSLGVFGYRFESPEKPGAPHDYPHAQPILGWHPRVPCLQHPHSSGDDVADCAELVAMSLGHDEDYDRSIAAVHAPVVSEERPAFPLICGRTFPGLALAMLASIYGLEYARVILDNEAKLRTATGRIGDDLSSFRA